MKESFLKGWNNAISDVKKVLPYATVLAACGAVCNPISQSDVVSVSKPEITNISPTQVAESVSPEKQELLNALRRQEALILDQLARILKSPPAHKGKQIIGGHFNYLSNVYKY